MLQDNVHQTCVQEHGSASMEEIDRMPSEFIAFLLQIEGESEILL